MVVVGARLPKFSPQALIDCKAVCHHEQSSEQSLCQIKKLDTKSHSQRNRREEINGENLCEGVLRINGCAVALRLGD